jgi:ABC-type Fe3+-hydroxamate transport system substrate-binding protein
LLSEGVPGTTSAEGSLTQYVCLEDKAKRPKQAYYATLTRFHFAKDKRRIPYSKVHFSFSRSLAWWRAPASGCVSAILLIAITALTGCQVNDAGDKTRRTFTDDLDRTVELPGDPDRVVALAPNLTEIVYAAGAGSTLVGASTADDFPPATDTLPRFSAYPPGFEKIAALRPDVALATDQVNNPQDAKTLSGLGIPTVFFSFNEVGDVFEAVRTVGRLLGTEDAAKQTADSLETALATLHRKTGRAESRPRVLFLIGAKQLYFFGKESYAHTLIEAAGGTSVTADLERTSSELSEEFVLKARPDVIIGSFADSIDAAALAAMHPTWKEAVPAVREGRVHAINGNLILRPGPRIVKGARRMARVLHPGLFASAGSDSQAYKTRP